jgi:hypothetical protein
MNTLVSWASLQNEKKKNKNKNWTKPPNLLFDGSLIPMGTNHYPKSLSLLETHYSGTTRKWVIYIVVQPHVL